MWIEEIPKKVKNPKKKKSISSYRERKWGVHTTIGGMGIIAKLRRKKNGKK